MIFLGVRFGKKATFKFDKKSNGWLAYYEDVKGIVGQGKTKNEAFQCLERDFKEINEMESKKIKTEKYIGDIKKPRMAHS